MSTEARATTMGMRARPLAGRTRSRGEPPASGLEVFERLYVDNVEVVAGYFARRCRDPQTVADLTSETFVRAIDGFNRFDPARGSGRAWVFGIATRVFAAHCDRSANGREAIERLGGRRALEPDEFDELAERIDAERDGAALLELWAGLPGPEREAIALVDLEELSPKEAAQAIGISRVAFRTRLSRARARLRNRHHLNQQEHHHDE